MSVGMVAVIMTFCMLIVGIITDHFEKKEKYKHKMIKDQLELEKIKHENYLLETEKMRLELEKMKIEAPKDESKIP